VTTIEGKAIYRRIDEAKKVNMDRWFTNHPDIYQNLLSAITSQVARAPVLPMQVSPEAPKAMQSRADTQDEYRVLKTKTITSLILARHSINANGNASTSQERSTRLSKTLFSKLLAMLVRNTSSSFEQWSRS
jgi:hypothetical protein